MIHRTDDPGDLESLKEIADEVTQIAATVIRVMIN
jgi:hypothetical protein